MTPQSSPPSYGSSGYGSSGSPSGSAPTNGSPQRMALDNIIRRELRVSDPNDPNQIAQALLTRYKDTPRAQAISQEAKGLPFLQAAPMQALVPQAATSSDAELQQAKDDVDRDLHELTTSSLLKDVTPEIQGWAQAVRSAIQEGATAARFALDPRQRDKALGMRRQLGDYARMVRLVGTLTPTLSTVYRKFAQSLDEVSAILLVLMGEALANAGINGGRFLLQVPYTELQVRRDAAIYALRNLSGATQEAYGPNDWPRGLDGYRLLFRELETQGQGDLRSLLVETELARVMDELIARANHGRAEGLRALGVTAQLDLERFRRLVVVAQRLAVDVNGQPTPLSPPLTAFLEGLLLFAEAFDTTGGFRLMRIARPPILFYGLYGIRTVDPAEDRLLQIILQRNLLADRLDCFLECGCSGDALICQVILDKILYDADRAIDYYAIGTENFGIPEQRASAFGLVICAFTGDADCPPPLDSNIPLGFPFASCVAVAPTVSVEIRRILDSLDSLLRPATPTPLFDNLFNGVFPITSDAQEAFHTLLIQELCLQRDNERRWRNLVATMAPDCAGFDNVFAKLDSVLVDALNRIGDTECPPVDILLPPHYEVSLGSAEFTGS